MSVDPLYRAAREATDSVLGPGAYAHHNAANPDPEVRDQVIASMRAEAIALCRRLGCTCRPEPRMYPTSPLGPYRLPAWTSEHDDGCELSHE